jgi:hypothetical protein
LAAAAAGFCGEGSTLRSLYPLYSLYSLYPLYADGESGGAGAAGGPGAVFGGGGAERADDRGVAHGGASSSPDAPESWLKPEPEPVPE